MLPVLRPLAGLYGISMSTRNPTMARCDRDNTQSLLISPQVRPVEGGVVCRNRAWRTCPAVCVDEDSFRMFLCARCRSQALVCRRCDRGQIYCTPSCAHDARCDHQREARRRHQATPRGRAMHAERNRRYRARASCVTDQGPAHEPETGPWRGLQVSAAPSARADQPVQRHRDRPGPRARSQRDHWLRRPVHTGRRYRLGALPDHQAWGAVRRNQLCTGDPDGLRAHPDPRTRAWDDAAGPHPASSSSRPLGRTAGATSDPAISPDRVKSPLL